MATIVRSLLLAVAFCVAASSTAQAAVATTFDFRPPALAGGTTGQLVIQLADIPPGPSPETLGSFNIDLGLTAAFGSLGGGTVTFSNFTPNFTGSIFFPVPPPAAAPLMQGQSVNLQGIFSAVDNQVGPAPRDFITIDYMTSAPLALGTDGFTVDLVNNPLIANTSFANVFAGSTPNTVTGVPEPGSMACCTLLAVGAGGRYLKRRRKQKKAEASLAC